MPRVEIHTLSSPFTSSNTGGLPAYPYLLLTLMGDTEFVICVCFQNCIRAKLLLVQNYLVFSSLNSSTPATPSLFGGRSRLHLIDFGCCERTKTLGGSITQVNLILLYLLET